MDEQGLEQLKQKAGEVSELLSKLANPDRFLLLCTLAEQECNVSELAARTGIQQPTLSQQLTVLRNQALVGTRREGKYIYYHLHDERVLSLMQAMYEIFCAHKPI